MQGPVLQPFSYDEAHPYAAGQHRGIDIGADAAGETVVAPAAGTVSFAGTVPTNGKSVTIETADGYSVTLTHLGSIAVAKGAAVAEQDAVGTVGPSGTPEVDGPYVHLGIRVTADPNGYVDPLGLLPPAPESSCDARRDSTASQPARAAIVGCAREQAGACGAEEAAGGDLARIASCCTEPRLESTAQERAARAAREGPDEPVVAPPCRARSRERADDELSLGGRSSSRWRPGRSVSTPATSCGRPVSVAPPRRKPSSPLPALVVQRAAALFALGVVLAASRRRRRSSASPTGSSCRAASCAPARHARRKPLRARSYDFGPSPSLEGAVAGAGNAAEDPRRGRVALRERPAAPRPRRRPRRAVGRLRALSPAQGQRRPHGQRDGRARHAGDGVRRPRRRDPA